MNMGKSKDRLDSHAINYARSVQEEKEMMQKIYETDERRFQEFIGVLSDLSNSIRDLATATVNKRPPIVLNLIANNDEDLKKFATIFAQEIK